MFIPFRKKYIENYWKKENPRLHGGSKFYKNMEKNIYRLMYLTNPLCYIMIG